MKIREILLACDFTIQSFIIKKSISHLVKVYDSTLDIESSENVEKLIQEMLNYVFIGGEMNDT